MYLPDWFLLLLLPETWVIAIIVVIVVIVGIVKAIKRNRDVRH